MLKESRAAEPGMGFYFSYEKARKAQKLLAEKLVIKPLGEEPKLISGVDVAYTRTGLSVGVSVIGDLEHKRILEQKIAITRARLPYVPGLLAYREVKPMVAALKAIGMEPDIVLVDGHGYMHPRRLGVASHISLIFRKPVIGIAKKKLIGEPLKSKGKTYVVDGGEIVGAILDKPRGAKELFISVGGFITLDEAYSIVEKLRRDRGLPFPLNIADRVSRRIAREING